MAHPALIEKQELDLFLDAVRAGDTMTVAAKKAGWSLNALRNRIDRDPDLSERFAEARGVGTHARADLVDEKFDAWVDEEKASPAIRIVWAKRWNPGYREKVEVTGAFVPPAQKDEDDWTVNLENVLGIIAEAGVKMTLEPAKEENGPSRDVPGAALLPAPPD